MATDNSLLSLHRLVWTALMAALVAAGAFITVPLGPVPFTMQTFFVALAGFVLGPVYGSLSICLYLLAGAAGLPVFSKGNAGIGYMLGPTGGFLIGFVFAALLSGMAGLSRDRFSVVAGFLWGLAGMGALYGLGLVWLKYQLDFTWTKSFNVAVAPFVLMGVGKLALAVACCKLLRKNKVLPV